MIRANVTNGLRMVPGQFTGPTDLDFRQRVAHLGRATLQEHDEQPYRPTTDQFIRNGAQTGQLHRWHQKRLSHDSLQDKSVEEKPKSAEGQKAEQARLAQKEQDELRQLFLRLVTERQKAMAQTWKILRDTHTDMFKILQQAWLFRAKAGRKAMGAWANYLTDVAWKDW